MTGDHPRVVAMICLTVMVCTAIVGLTFVAVLTDRNVHLAEGFTFGGAVLVAIIGGLTFHVVRSRDYDVRGNGPPDAPESPRAPVTPTTAPTEPARPSGPATGRPTGSPGIAVPGEP